MLAGASGGFGHRGSHSCRAALRNDNAVGARGICRTQNRTQIVWIFHAVEHDYQRELASLGRYHVVEIVILLARRDGDYTLMGVVSGHLIEFRPRHEPYGDSLSPALVHDTLQAQIVSFLGYAYPGKGACACFQ